MTEETQQISIVGLCVTSVLLAIILSIANSCTETHKESLACIEQRGTWTGAKCAFSGEKKP